MLLCSSKSTSFLSDAALTSQGDECVVTAGSNGGELERCYIAPWGAAAIYSGLSTVIEAVAFAFHRRFTVMNDEGTRCVASRPAC